MTSFISGTERFVELVRAKLLNFFRSGCRTKRVKPREELGKLTDGYVRRLRVFFKKTELHCKGRIFDKCTVRVEISVNLGIIKNFCPKV